MKSVFRAQAPDLRRAVGWPGCLVSLLLSFLFAAPVWAGEALTLQLKWTHAFQFAGFYAAEAQGYYRDAGLDVQILEASPETNVVNRVTSGEVEFGIGTSSLLLDRQQGKPVVALAAIFQHSPQVILSRLDHGLQSVHDLGGKRLMLEGQTGELLAYLQREGVRRESLVLQPHSFKVDELIAGQTDAISAYQTNEPFLLDQRQFRHMILTPRAAGIDFYGDVLFTSQRQVKEHPERTRAFIRASLRGWQYAVDHPDEMIALIRARYPERASLEHLKFEAMQTIPLIRADLVPVGYMHPGRWRHIAETYAEIGMLPPTVDLGDFVYQPEQAVDYSLLYRWLAIAACAILLVGGIALRFVRLNRQLESHRQALAEHASDLELQNHVLAQLNAHTPLPDVLATIALGVEARHRGVKCSILLLDESGKHLLQGAAPSLPDFYNQAIDGVAIGDGVGSCGTAAYRRERVIVEDIAHHPYWQNFTELAARAGLGACWSQPITSTARGHVLGTFAIYHATPATPAAREFSLIERYASLTALAIEQSRTDAELDRYRRHLEQMVEERTAALSVAKESAEAAHRAKNTFLATMSHELRTPLHALIGMLSLALRKAVDESQRKQLQISLTGARQLLEIISDVLDIARLEAERLHLRAVPFALGGLIDNLQSLVGSSAQAKGLAFVIEAPDDLLSLQLQGDPYRLGQILHNLCGNAVKFTEHGRVVLSLTTTEAPPGHCGLRFEVADTGIGIGDAAQRRLFKPFEQADGSTTRRHGGTGLGLAISKRLAEMMGGEMGFTSVEGQGSRFWFTVSLATTDQGTQTAPADDGAARLRRDFSGMHILLADHDPASREASRSLLQSAGLGVETAEDGRQAVDMALGGEYSLILMEIALPNLNGLQATQAIRAAGHKEIPIVAMTDMELDADRQHCIGAGMNDQIAKPVDPERLYATLLQWLVQKEHPLLSHDRLT